MKTNQPPQYIPTHTQKFVQFSGDSHDDPFNNDYGSEADQVDFSERAAKQQKEPKHAEPQISNKQKAAYYGKKTGWGVLAGLLGLTALGGYSTALETVSEKTANQDIYEDVKAEVAEMKEREGFNEEATHLEHFFSEIYDNLFLDGEINQAQLNTINEQLNNLENTNLTEEQISRLNLLIEASEDVDTIEGIQQLNKTFLDLYIEDAAERDALLEISERALAEGYSDAQLRSGGSQFTNFMIYAVFAMATFGALDKVKDTKKPEPKPHEEV